MYDVIRHYRNGRKKIILKGVSLEITKLHCSSPNTSKPGKWFDGYTTRDFVPMIALKVIMDKEETNGTSSIHRHNSSLYRSKHQQKQVISCQNFYPTV